MFRIILKTDKKYAIKYQHEVFLYTALFNYTQVLTIQNISIAFTFAIWKI